MRESSKLSVGSPLGSGSRAQPTLSGDLVLTAKGGGLKLAGAAIASLGALAVTILMGRFLGPADFGRYRIAVILGEIFGQISDLGLRSSSLRFVPIAVQRGDYARIRGVLRISQGVPVALGAGIAIILFLSADVVATKVFDDPKLVVILRLIALVIPLAALANASEAIVRAFQRFDLSVLGRDVTFHIARTIGTAGVLLAGLGVAWGIIAHGLALLCASALLAGIAYKIRPADRRWLKPRYALDETWRQAAPMHLTRLLHVMGMSLETLVLGIFGLSAGVGVYTASLQLSRLANMLPEALITVSMPVIAGAYDQDGRERLAPVVRTVARWSFAATFPLFLAFVAFRVPLLNLIGQDFEAGATALILLGMMPLANSVAGISTAVLAMTGNARLNVVNSSILVATALSLDLLLIPNFGLIGAAIAALTANFAMNAARLVEISVIYQLWPFDRNFLKTFLAGGLAFGILSLTSDWLQFGSPLCELLIGVPLLFAVYAICMALQGLAPEDRDILSRIPARLGLAQLNRNG